MKPTPWRSAPGIWIEIGPGELCDRLSILYLKVRHADESRRDRLAAQCRALEAAYATLPWTPALNELDRCLADVNARLWDIESEIRDCLCQDPETPRIPALAREIPRLNDRRSELKAAIDRHLGSDALTDCKLYPALKE